MLITYNAIKDAVTIHADNDNVENRKTAYDINCTRMNSNYWLLSVYATGNIKVSITDKISNLSLVKRLNKIAQSVPGGFDITLTNGSCSDDGIERVETGDVVKLHLE